MNANPQLRSGLTALSNPTLRIALVAPPAEPVPPPGYGGTERVIAELARELTSRGHDVTLFASGDSDVPCALVPTVPRALRPANEMESEEARTITTILDVARQADRFDLIHAHLEWYNPLLAAFAGVPTAMTFHGRLDFPFAPHVLSYAPRGLVAISAAQMAAHDSIPWEGVVHNGLDLSRSQFETKRSDALCFVGRIAPEKGAVDAIEIARRTGRPLRIAAKKGVTPKEVDYFESVFEPALEGADVEYLGELSSPDRDKLLSESYASLMPGSWPEPFGLVAIESLACGTPVICRRVGALPEIVREGVDGYFGDDATAMAFRVGQVDNLDRKAIRESVINRFSAKRMTDGYEKIYAALLEDRPGMEASRAAGVAAGASPAIPGSLSPGRPAS